MNAELLVIDGLRAGNEQAYKYLFDHYYELLCKFAYGYVHDTSVAEMIVSDVFFVIWKNHIRLEINQSLRKYLLKSVQNGCFNYAGRQARLVGIDEVDCLITDRLSGKEEVPLTALIEKEIDLQINHCLKALPRLTNEIFCLSRFEELKYSEIAIRLNVSVDVVKYHIKSALSHLRSGLKEYLMLLILFLC